VRTRRDSIFLISKTTKETLEYSMKPQLKIGDVSSATGVPIPTLGRWLDRRTIKQSSSEHHSTGTGDHRTFNRATINQIAIAKKLTELGVSATPANAAASLFTHQPQPGRAANESFKQDRTLLVLRATGPMVINLPYDADFCDLADHGTAFVAIDCGKICKEVDEALSHKTI
jgi:DNA-binding transcriptional MerR regulator